MPGLLLGLGAASPAAGKSPAFPAYDLQADLGADLFEDWDAASGVTQAGTVSAWAGAKAGNILAQATSGNRPAYEATGFNGRPCLRGNGTNQWMGLEGVPASFPKGALPVVRIMALVEQEALPADTTIRNIFGYGGNTSLTALGIRRAVVSGVNRARSTIRSTNETESVSDFSGRKVIEGLFLEGGTLSLGTAECFVNGNSDGLSNVGTSDLIASTRVRLFSTTLDAAASFYQGRVNRILIMNGLTSAAKVGRARAFLSLAL